MPSSWSVMIWMTIGSSIGGAIPLLWGGDMFSIAGFIGTIGGGILGVFIAVKIARFFE